MLPSSVRILVCTAPQDLRRSFDGLSGLVTAQLGQDPRSGNLFVFVNRRANRAKVLWFEKNGYCLLYKRLHRAIFRLPAQGAEGAASIRIDGRALAALLEGVAHAERASRRKRLDA
ncbi:MAG: IS66 family insertion sequence element accessory protein TnpB [Chloroflexi bacterium]|nr:IS66 family insertion sequence element accessory protein TnpB [Chloroflexota bacterium]